MPVRAVLFPILGYFGWVFLLYAWLTVARWRAVNAGQTTYSGFEFGREEPPGVARITRNLANQFELPMIFFAAVILLIQLGALAWWDVAMCWLFLARRTIHTAVQTLTSDVPLRGRVFMINFLGCAGLVAHLGLVALGV